MIMSYLYDIKSTDDIKKLNITQLASLADEVREFLIKNVMQTGGHLASNLGVAELTIAMMYAFDFPGDKVVFDVGHQCYVYKMLTGRLNRFDTLRRLGGLSGFPKCTESVYDSFDVGHASTSISAAVGMARARDLDGRSENIIAVVGDGALTGGMCFEALNDVGSGKTKVIIILNDNEMSIQKNVGGLSAHLSKLRFSDKYRSTKTNIHGFLSNAGKVGKIAGNVLHNVKDGLKYATIAAPLFEDLGLTYMGIIDGNNISELVSAFNAAKRVEGPVLIHTFTKKGLGYEEAEKNPSKYHGVSSLTTRISRREMKYTDAFSALMTNFAANSDKVVGVTAAMTDGCGLAQFAAEYPDRFFDVGIAEEHAVTMSAGLAKGGYTPVFAVYSTFLQRSYDQIIHDVCMQNLHVVLAVDHGGLTGEDGETHQGLMDMVMLSHIPNMTLLMPSCYDEFKQMMHYAVFECTSPVAVRYPKGQVSFRNITAPFETGVPEIVQNGGDILIVSCGRMTDTALCAAEKLKADGISACIVNLRTAEISDKSVISKLSEGKKAVFTVEDGIVSGGVGEHIAASCNFKCSFFALGFDTCYVPHGKQSELFAMYGLDADGIYSRIKKEIEKSD